jgi:hypothetical protein
MHSEGPATGHLDTGFLVFPFHQANAEVVPKLQVAAACFSCSPPDFKLIIIIPVVDAADIIVFHIVDKTIRN